MPMTFALEIAGGGSVDDWPRLLDIKQELDRLLTSVLATFVEADLVVLMLKLPRLTGVATV